MGRKTSPVRISYYVFLLVEMCADFREAHVSIAEMEKPESFLGLFFAPWLTSDSYPLTPNTWELLQFFAETTVQEAVCLRPDV